MKESPQRYRELAATARLLADNPFNSADRLRMIKLAAKYDRLAAETRD